MRLLGFILMLTTLFASGCAGAAAGSPSAQGNYAAVARRLSGEIRQAMAKHKVKGLSIALVDGQDVVWAEAFGWADEAGKIPARTDTVYRVGSVSKVFTSMAVMTLAERGMLDIDVPLARYLPEFSIRSRFPESGPITLRSMMTHHSGLPSDVLKGMFVDHPLTLAQYVPTLAVESMASPVGTEFMYSNIAFSLLGRVIEKSENLPFAQAMEQLLLGPLGMDHSGFARNPALAAHLAKGYRQGVEIPYLPLRDAPTGALMSTAEDMSLFLRFVLAKGRSGGRRVLGEQTLASMLEQQYPGQPLDFGHRQGLGWMLSGLALADGEQLVWHNGAVIPFQSHLAVLPESGLGVVLLANTDEASSILTTLGIKALELAKQVKFGRPAPVKKPQALPAAVSLPSPALDAVAGDYAMQLGLLTPVWPDGQRLSIFLWNQHLHLVPVGPAEPLSSVTFLPYTPAVFGLFSEPLPDMLIQRQVTGGREFLYRLGSPLPFALEKIPPEPIPSAWLARLGRYAADTTGELLGFESMELYTKSGLLLAKVTILPGDRSARRAEGTIVLRPVSEDEAVVAGVGNSTGEVVRATPEGLYHSGYRYRLAPAAP